MNSSASPSVPATARSATRRVGSPAGSSAFGSSIVRTLSDSWLWFPLFRHRVRKQERVAVISEPGGTAVNLGARSSQRFLVESRTRGVSEADWPVGQVDEV